MTLKNPTILFAGTMTKHSPSFFGSYLRDRFFVLTDKELLYYNITKKDNPKLEGKFSMDQFTQITNIPIYNKSRVINYVELEFATKNPTKQVYLFIQKNYKYKDNVETVTEILQKKLKEKKELKEANLVGYIPGDRTASENSFLLHALKDDILWRYMRGNNILFAGTMTTKKLDEDIFEDRFIILTNDKTSFMS